MTGFGLYETLRLIVPGGVAVAVFSLVLRLATGEGALLEGGRAHDVVESLNGASFLFASLVVGFVLYLIDMPARARIFDGDPDNGYILPTNALREMLDGTPHKKSYFSMYFILSDGRLPPELHRRIYFFGGLYRIYFDARVLTAAGIALGGPLALATMGEGSSPWIGLPYLAFVIGLISFLAAIIVVAESRHAIESMRKHGRDDDRLPYPSREARGAYLRRTSNGVLEVALAAGAVVVMGVVAGLLADASPAGLRFAGVSVGACAFALWVMVELGPTRWGDSDNKVHGNPVRGRVLAFLRLRPDSRAQYSQLQRGIMDLALIGPALVCAGVGAELRDRDPSAVLLWASLAVPCVLIMAIRKHEQRLLNSYRDQVNWLQINRERILAIANGESEEWI